jgi:uncharacterized protein YgiM (DUF1202 family)
MRRWLALVLSGCIVVSVSQAQDACPAFELSTLASLAPNCAELEAGQACTLSEPIFVNEMRPLLTAERVPLNELAQLASSIEAQQWGMVHLRTRAYTSVNWLTEVASVYVFGTTTVSSTPTQNFLLNITVVPTQGVNIRAFPSNEGRIIEPTQQGEVLKAVGRLEDNSWAQILLRDGTVGWVNAQAFNDDLNVLRIVTAEAPLTIIPPIPFTDIVITTPDTPNIACAGTPASGLIIQTEQINDLALPLSFHVNGVDLNILGTVFLNVYNLTPTPTLQAYVLDGELEVLALGQSVEVTEGQYSTVLLDANRTLPVEIADEARPYNYEAFYNLPVTFLWQPFYVAVDASPYIRPRPEGDISPLSSMLASEPCRLTTGEGGTNIRAGAGTQYPIMGVLGFRESVAVVGRASDANGQNWWNIAPYLWVSGQTTVTGGDCVSVPIVPNPPVR